MKIKYKDIVGKMDKNSKSFLYDFRRKMAETYLLKKKRGERTSFRRIGIEFGVNKKTVEKWVNRYKKKCLTEMKDKSRSPKRIHNKMSKEEEKRIVKLREETGFGAKRLKREFNLKRSHGAIERVLREYKLINKNKYKKHNKKKNLRAIKEKLKVFEKIQVDIKYINDIPEFYPYYFALRLPKYQISFRDVKSGAAFVFYTREKSVISTITASLIVLKHLKKYGIKSKDITFQTDNGAEFSGIRKYHDRGYRFFLTNICKINHIYIPPRYPNANADVESFHRLIEEEFYRREPIKSKKEFLSKIFTYLCYFNCIRQNSYRNFKTPLDYIKEKKINPEILILPPVFIDDIIYDDKVGLSILTNIMKKKKKYKKKLTHHVTRIPEIILEENFICLI